MNLIGTTPLIRLSDRARRNFHVLELKLSLIVNHVEVLDNGLWQVLLGRFEMYTYKPRVTYKGVVWHYTLTQNLLWVYSSLIWCSIFSLLSDVRLYLTLVTQQSFACPSHKMALINLMCLIKFNLINDDVWEEYMVPWRILLTIDLAQDN